MTRMFFEGSNCGGVTSGATGREYDAKNGFIDVSDSRDIACLKSGGYLIAGGMPKVKKFYLCECGWEASISHCPKCDRDDLTRIEK